MEVRYAVSDGGSGDETTGTAKNAGAVPAKLVIVPMELVDANAFVARHHRHSRPVRGHKFSIGVADANGTVAGVAIVGRPVSRGLDDGWTLEITRVATDGTRNACSLLEGAACRAAFAIGYRRVVTYTRKSETGASLRGAGFRQVAEVRARDWSTPSRPRVRRGTLEDKWRWERVAS